MKLGTDYGEGLSAEILTVSKWLDLLPDWSIVRNGCDSEDGESRGSYLIKVPVPSGFDWQWYDPKTGTNQSVDPGGYHIQSRDVFLPVQVVRRGPK